METLDILNILAFASFAVLLVAWLVAPSKGELIALEDAKKAA
jgi:hypothetical protein